ncbi:MAG: hypothetical protein R2705_09475 [Ilumatobacteraceae bacterium]
MAFMIEDAVHGRHLRLAGAIGHIPTDEDKQAWAAVESATDKLPPTWRSSSPRVEFVALLASITPP